MIQIFSKKNIKIDRVSHCEPFLVCEKKATGELLIMGLEKYLKAGQGGGVAKKKREPRGSLLRVS